MKSKKSTQASLENRGVLYFLLGLNVVLVTVWFAFNSTSELETSTPESITLTENLSENITYIIPDIEKPLPETEELPAPTVPEPDLTQIEEVPEMEVIKEIKVPDIKKVIVTENQIKKPDNISLKNLKDNVEKVEEERIPEVVTANVVNEMAIYPGCEKFVGNKKALVQCFGEKLSHDIIKNLDKNYPDIDKESVGVQLHFLVNTNGEITDIQPIRGDEEFKAQAKRALEKAALKLKKSGKRIQPAKMIDGSKAILKFNRSVILKKP